jgi:hypothetical protein
MLVADNMRASLQLANSPLKSPYYPTFNSLITNMSKAIKIDYTEFLIEEVVFEML